MQSAALYCNVQSCVSAAGIIRHAVQRGKEAEAAFSVLSGTLYGGKEKRKQHS